jgi:tRNA threonylcarbamoyladenosine biosynthesis protein TsaB
MTKLLAIDSSTEACSVALSIEGQVFSEYQISPRKHAELLLPMVDSVLSEAKSSLKELDAIACCVGPGAFTGLRIAISMAQSLAYASNKPCIEISSLQLLAAQAFQQSQSSICLASIDARMNEVYFAAFKRGADGLPALLSAERVVAPLEIELDSAFLAPANLSQLEIGQVVVAGSGWTAYEYGKSLNKIKQLKVNEVYPNAARMLPIAEKSYAQGEIINASKMRPSYLRNNVAKKKSAQH